MPVNLNSIGSYGEPLEITWDESDCMLYALSIGLSYPEYTEDLKYTTDNTSGVELQVLPTFATVIG